MTSKSVSGSASQAPRLHVAPRLGKTYGDLAGDLAGDYGLKPDPWQQIVLDDWLAESAGKWASLTCGLSVPRQNGKNSLLEVRELFGLVRGEKILHTAHLLPTARKAFKRLTYFFGSQADDPGAKFPELNALVESVRWANGQEAVILKNGGSVEVVARSKNSGRGFTVDTLVCDEAQEMSDDDLEALMPTTSSAPMGNPQWIFTGTPPGPNANGEVFTRVREEALAGDSKRLSWHEWSIPDEADARDLTLAQMANPALLSGRLQLAVVEGELKRFSLEGFARERGGRWDRVLGGLDIFGGGWAECAAPFVKGPVGAFAIAAPTDLSYASISAAYDGERVQVRPVKQAEGLGWVVAAALRLQKMHGRPVVIDAGGPASMLVPLLEQAGVELVVPKAAEFFNANANLFELVRDRRLAHDCYPELDDEVRNAQLRNADRAVLDRKKSNVAVLESVMLAAWLVTKPVEPKKLSAYESHGLIVI